MHKHDTYTPIDPNRFKECLGACLGSQKECHRQQTPTRVHPLQTPRLGLYMYAMMHNQ
jgi:hypothetical protein